MEKKKGWDFESKKTFNTITTYDLCMYFLGRCQVKVMQWNETTLKNYVPFDFLYLLGYSFNHYYYLRRLHLLMCITWPELKFKHYI